MGLITKLSVALLSFGTLIAGTLPSMARPYTLTTDSNLRTGSPDDFKKRESLNIDRYHYIHHHN